MENRNIILLVIDTLSYKVLEQYPFPEELFLNNYIKKHSILYENVYTQGPYTEASMNGVAYGQRALDGGTYMFGHACFSHSFVDNIHEKYNTFCSGMSCRLFIDNCYKSFDKFHYHYYSPTVLSTLNWTRLEHFINLNKKRSLTSNEIGCISTLLSYSISHTLKFLENYKNKQYETSLSNNYIIEKKADDLLEKVNALQQSYENDKVSLINDVLEEKINIGALELDYQVPYEETNTALSFFKNYSSKLLKIVKKKYRHNFQTIMWLFSNIKTIKTSGLKEFLKNEIKILKFPSSQKLKLTKTYNELINGITKKKPISFDRCIPEILSFIKDNISSKKPFFVYCQPDDFHPTPVFWSYDSNDLNKIKIEFDEALSLANKIKKQNCNFFEFLSIRYIDSKIKTLFQELDKMNLLNNTDVIITADHGSWEYGDYPSTRKLIMTEERSHIPCYFFRLNQMQKKDYNLHLNYSLPNTILKYEGFDTDNYFYGKAFSEDKNEFLLIENLGFGCPDIYNVPIRYVVLNNRYKLLIVTSLKDCISSKNCIELFDRKKDCLERFNILKQFKKKNQVLFQTMISVAKKRHEELQKKYINGEYCEPNIL